MPCWARRSCSSNRVPRSPSTWPLRQTACLSRFQRARKVSYRGNEHRQLLGRRSDVGGRRRRTEDGYGLRHFVGFSREPQGGALFFSEEQPVPCTRWRRGRWKAASFLGRDDSHGTVGSCSLLVCGKGHWRWTRPRNPGRGHVGREPRQIHTARPLLPARSTSAGGVGLSAEMGKALEAILAKLRPIQTAI